MIRCVRLWTGEDGNSLFEEGFIDLTEDSFSKLRRRNQRARAQRSGSCSSDKGGATCRPSLILQRRPLRQLFLLPPDGWRRRVRRNGC
jgi:hypothetical protein